MFDDKSFSTSSFSTSSWLFGIIATVTRIRKGVAVMLTNTAVYSGRAISDIIVREKRKL